MFHDFSMAAAFKDVIMTFNLVLTAVVELQIPGVFLLERKTLLFHLLLLFERTLSLPLPHPYYCRSPLFYTSSQLRKHLNYPQLVINHIFSL